VQIASKVYTYIYAPLAPAVNDTVSLVNTQRLPTIFLQPGFTVVVAIASAQVGDQISAIRLYVERFDTGPQGFPIGMVEEPANVQLVESLSN
jgi:hypothetical protein